jgi:hypothetical protein
MRGIFISYRRDDSRGDAGRLVRPPRGPQRQEERVRDIDDMAPGDRFPDVLE